MFRWIKLLCQNRQISCHPPNLKKVPIVTPAFMKFSLINDSPHTPEVIPMPSIKALRRFVGASLLSMVSLLPSPIRAGDKTWNNGDGNFLWDTTSLNWTGTAWNNAAGDGAIFNLTGAGAVDVSSTINVNSLNFTVNGYSLNGTGSLNFVNGTSTQT